MAAVFPKAKELFKYKHPGILYAVCTDPAARRLYAGSFDYGVYVFDLAAEKKEPAGRWASHKNYVSCVTGVMGGDKPILISGSFDRQLVWWDTESGKPTRTQEGHAGWVRALAAFPDGERIASVGDDMHLKIWEAKSGREILSVCGHNPETPQSHPNALYALSISPDGSYIATADRTAVIRVWEAASGEIVQTFEVPILYTYDPKHRKRSIGGIRTIAFSPDGRVLAAGGISTVKNVDGLEEPPYIELWDWQSPKRLVASKVEEEKGLVHGLVFHPSGRWLIGAGGGGKDGFLLLYDLADLDKIVGDEKAELPVQTLNAGAHYQGATLSADGSELYLPDYQGLAVWSLGRYRRF